jgi:TonB family protein
MMAFIKSGFLNELMLAAGGSLAASIVTKATLTMAAALVGAWAARRNRAAVRHALLAAGFGALLLLPAGSVLTKPVRISVTAVERAPVQAASRVVTGRAVAVPPGSGMPAETWMLWGWAAGAALFLLPVTMGLWQVRRLRASALPWRQGQSVAEELTKEAGIRRRVEVLLHGSLPGPMTCGVAHPAIVLPVDAESWEAEDLKRAMVHELEHVRRFDWVSHCLARVACAMYWFHPLVWIGWRQLVLEAERSCDDAVLGRSEATAYADQLVGLARRLSAKAPMLAMANRADLAARVGSVLDGRQRRGRAGALVAGMVCAAAAVFVVTMSPLRMIAAPQVAAPQGAGGAGVPRLMTKSALVMESVKVTDAGRSLEGLGAGDFVVTEDGVPQNVRIFEYQRGDAAVPSYYLLGYYAKPANEAGTFRKIEITLSGNAGARLEYRPGYTTRGEAGDVFAGVPTSATGNAMEPGTRPPVLLFKYEPEYSEAARQAKWQGAVVLQVDIDETGQVTNIRVLRDLGLGLNEKAIEAIGRWRFRPATKDGKAVAVQVQVGVDFRLL